MSCYNPLRVSLLTCLFACLLIIFITLHYTLFPYFFHFSLPDPPSITASPASPVQILNTAMFNLSCSADGQPYPTIVWVRSVSVGLHSVFNKSSIAENRRNFTLSYSSISATIVMSTFSVYTSMIDDTGNYSCIAENRLGSSSSNISMVSIYSTLHIFGSKLDHIDFVLLFIRLMNFCRNSFCHLSYKLGIICC